MLGRKKERNFDNIVAPLTKIEEDLTAYIGEQVDKRSSLEEDKKDIEKQIETSRLEKKKSEHTVTKISELLGTHFTISDLDDETESEPAVEVADSTQIDSDSEE